MTKLWQKKYSLDKNIEKFTVGTDYIIDKKLIQYDIFGNLAHAAMLNKIGILQLDEYKKLKNTLIELSQKCEEFEIKIDDEDVHTAIENYLTEKLGDIGKKIHTARSRNDQVLVDLRLYMKDELLTIKKLVLELILALTTKSTEYEYVAMPGYTHMQKAMPSSVGLWLMSFAESMIDNIKLIDAIYEINNQCPLGSGAGYGSGFPIDRQYVSDLLGFKKVQNNSMYIQNSRGKIEAQLVFTLSNIHNDLSKFATDVLLFSMPEFGYVSLPKEVCTGSSIMPQKQNLDLMELTRAKSSTINAKYQEIIGIIQKLPSGYNRDFQLIKGPLFEAIDICKETLIVNTIVIELLIINKENMLKACTPELFATDEANKLVLEGTPFREAYKIVGENIHNLTVKDPIENIKNKKHLGATGNLNISGLNKELSEYEIALLKEQNNYNNVKNNLLKKI